MNEISIWINQRQFCSNLLFQRLQNGKSAQLQTIVFLMLAVVQTVLKLHLKPDLGLENQSRIKLYHLYKCIVCKKCFHTRFDHSRF